MFPSSMLAQLFVKGSLKNTETGFEFKLKNIIDSGTLIGFGPLGVDDGSVAPDAVTVRVGEKVLRGDQISTSSPLPIRSYTEAVLTVAHAPLAEGPHKLTFMLLTREAGRLQFSVSEKIA